MESELESRNQLLREGFLKLPAQEAPPGVIPNFTHPSTTIYNAYTVIVILGVTLATTSVAIKMCNQLWLMRKVHLEDYCLMISWVVMTRPPSKLYRDSNTNSGYMLLWFSTSFLPNAQLTYGHTSMGDSYGASH